MAAVNITISPAVLIDKFGRTIMSCAVVGEASITGLGVGGGPIIPPDQPPDGGDGKPPGIWGGPIDPYPGHPLPPTEPPSGPPEQSSNWQWGWNRAQGWHPVYVPGPSDPGPH